MNKLTLALTALPIEDPSKVFPVSIEIKDDGIFLRTGGREAWIEVDCDGNLIVHAYNEGIDEPVNLRICETCVVIDTDREEGFRTVRDKVSVQAVGQFVVSGEVPKQK